MGREESMSESDPKDLDETRRLLYGALAASRTRRWELVGTLTNALVHHSGVEVDAHDVLETLVVLVENTNSFDESVRVQNLIGKVNDLIATLSNP